jgi:argininosuccinate synthase
MPKKEKVVLAYSGGLDTSVIIKWLIMQHDYEVIALYASLGQEKDTRTIQHKALTTGASKVYTEDLRERFLEQFCLPALWAHAVYEDRYFLSAALSRPLIAQVLVEVAKKEGAQAIAHGSTGKGNDQVRFDVSVMALAPYLKIIAPLRQWEFKSRQQEMDFAKEHNIPVEASIDKPYSIDYNLWGACIECGVLEDPWREPPEDIYMLTLSSEAAPTKPDYIELSFEQGRPNKLNGEELSLLNMVEKLNQQGGKHGIGRSDMVENRLVGIKSREIYEAPAANILHLAHSELEKLVLDKETLHFKQHLSSKYTQLIYDGLWFSPLKEALDAFFAQLQPAVTGTVRLRLHKGNCTVVGRKSDFSLYNLSLATYDERDTFDHKTGEAFCKIWGLPLKVKAERDSKVGN